MNSSVRKVILTVAVLGFALMPAFARGAHGYHIGRSDTLWQTAKSIASDSAQVFPDVGIITVREIGSDGAVIVEDGVSIYFHEDEDGGVIYADVAGDLRLAKEVAAFSTGYFDNPFVSGEQVLLSATGETIEIEGTECVEYKYRIDYGDHAVTGMIYIARDTGVPVRMDNELSATVDDLTVEVVRSLYYGYDGSKLFPAFAVLEGTKYRELKNQVWYQDIVITQEFSGYFVAANASL